MKKQILLFVSLVLAFSLHAQVFVENFETASVNGNLEGYNDWYVSLKSSDANGVSPKIEEYPLFYTDYPGSDLGHVAVLDSVVGANSSTQRISTRKIVFAPGDTLTSATSGGAMYFAFMVNVSSQSFRSFRDFITWEGSETASMTRGRIFAKNNTAGDEVTFAITKNSSTAADMVESGSLGLTLGTNLNHLLVMKYKVVDGSENDELYLYINPDPAKVESEQLNVLKTIDTQSDYSESTKIKINLRQRGVGALIGGIRVGRTWESVVMGQVSGLNPGTSDLNRIYADRDVISTPASGRLNVFSLSGVSLVSAATDGKFSSGLPAGMYLVSFTSVDGAVLSAKVLIR